MKSLPKQKNQKKNQHTKIMQTINDPEPAKAFAIRDYNVEKDMVALNSDKELAYFLLQVLNIRYPEQQKILHAIIHYCNCLYILEFDLPLFNTHETVVDNVPFFPLIHKMLLEIGNSNISVDDRYAIFTTLNTFARACKVVGFDDIVKSTNEVLINVSGNITPREIAQQFPSNDCEKYLQKIFWDIIVMK
jgi:hypothetical protein